MSRKKRKNNTINNLYHTPIVEIFTKHPYQYFNYKQIAAKLQVHGKEERQLIAKTIEQLLIANMLVRGNRGKYKLNPIHVEADASNIISGRLSMKQTGKAYLIVEGGEMDDVFISAHTPAQA